MQAPTPSTAVTSRCCPIRTSSSTLSVPPLRPFKDHPPGRDGRVCPNIKRMRSEARRDKRCSWVNVEDPLLLAYHDREWGVPVHSDPKHFEVLVLSGVAGRTELVACAEEAGGLSAGVRQLRS